MAVHVGCYPLSLFPLGWVKKLWVKLSVCDGADRQSEFKEVGRDMSPLFFFFLHT